MAARISKRPITRRDLLKSSSLLALSGVVPARTISGEVFLSEAGSRNLDVGPSIYESIGVRPIINCKGTFTIISGSQSLPECEEGYGRGFQALRPNGRVDGTCWPALGGDH